MNNRLNTTRSILLVFGLLTSGSGCHVLNIPSYRADSPAGLGGACSSNRELTGGETGQPGSLSSSLSGGDGCTVEQECPPGFFPPLPAGFFSSCRDWSPVSFPVPAWWAEWRAKKDLPEPPPYPRFHPLPTRPVFQPRPVSADQQWGEELLAPAPYGQLPAPEAGRVPWSSLGGAEGGAARVAPGVTSSPSLAPVLGPEPLPVPTELPPRRLPR